MPVKTYYLVKKYTPAGGDSSIPFYVEDVSGQSSTLNFRGYSDATNIEYSTDNETWSSTKPAIPANGRVYIRANATTWSTGLHIGNQSEIDVNHSYNVGGNTMSLFYGSNFTGLETTFPDMSKSNQLDSLLSKQGNLISAENLILPATILTDKCYSYMFYSCTSLTTAPTTLPATTLAQYCCTSMFSSCTSLTTAPELPATTLAIYCYDYMFENCTSLTKAPALPATTLVSDCYGDMFSGCTSLNEIKVGATYWRSGSTTNWVNGVAATGTFYKPTNTNIPTNTNGIPSGWTVVNV